jgi:hypothetical protein
MTTLLLVFLKHHRAAAKVLITADVVTSFDLFQSKKNIIRHVRVKENIIRHLQIIYITEHAYGFSTLMNSFGCEQCKNAVPW